MAGVYGLQGTLTSTLHTLRGHYTERVRDLMVLFPGVGDLGI